MGGRFGFLGPPGTFTQEALLQVADPESDDLVHYASVEEVIEAVQRGEVDRGMVPIENSVEGTVNATVDALGLGDDDLVVEREVILPIRLHLLARPDAEIPGIKRVFSMPHATAQCRRWLRDNLPGAETVAANSTAEAAGRVAYEPGAADKAAIGPSLAAHLYGLSVLARDVTDHAEAETRFVVAGRRTPPASGRDKTSLVCFIAQDRPDALLEILQCFAGHGINLTKVESRPTKRVLGEYCFFIDLQGHLSDPQVSEALSEVQQRVSRLKLLGSYPRALGALDAERLARRARSAAAGPGAPRATAS